MHCHHVVLSCDGDDVTEKCVSLVERAVCFGSFESAGGSSVEKVKGPWSAPEWAKTRRTKKDVKSSIRYFLQPLMSFFSLLCDAYILACSWSEYNTDYFIFFFFSHFRCNQNAHTFKNMYKMQNKHTFLAHLLACACGWCDSNLQYPSVSHNKRECWVTSVAWCYGCSTSWGWRSECQLSTSCSNNEHSHTHTHIQRPQSD